MLVSSTQARAALPSPDPSGLSYWRLLEGQTRHLRTFHAHMTAVEPGGGYEPHTDAYDVGIVVLEGTVETLGNRAGPHAVIFYPAGALHGLKNVGRTRALYIVFEFHGRRPGLGDSDGARLALRVLAVSRDPVRLVRAISRRARAAFEGVLRLRSR